jgi:hypothetical protein
MSLAQVEANRRNARLSTGPKTAAGQAASRLNALKHGLVARQVVLRGCRLQESSQEFESLCREFHESLAPDGPLEAMLVDRIVPLVWRLRRVPAAETGEIALSVDGGSFKRERDDPLGRLLSAPWGQLGASLVAHLLRSVPGLQYLMTCLRTLRQAVESAGELTDAALDTFKKCLRNEPDEMVEALDQFRARLASNPESLPPDALRARHREEVLHYLDAQIRRFGFLLEHLQQQAETQEKSEQAAALLPPPETLDKILRYETALERQLFRALNQLERVQRRRQGETVPPPLAVDISPRG